MDTTDSNTDVQHIAQDKDILPNMNTIQLESMDQLPLEARAPIESSEHGITTNEVTLSTFAPQQLANTINEKSSYTILKKRKPHAHAVLASEERANKRFRTSHIEVRERTESEDQNYMIPSDYIPSPETTDYGSEGDVEEDLNVEDLDDCDACDVDQDYPVEEQNEHMQFTDPTSIDHFIELFKLPPITKEIFHGYSRITHLYGWQQEVLNRMIESNCEKSLLYSLSTSAGKTLISEFMILHTCHVKHRNALLILPYVSLVEEKRTSLEVFSDFLHFHVESYFANKGTWPVPSLRDNEPAYVFVATIEKANTIINELIESNRLDELGCIVIDELHMIGDERSTHLATKSRGVLLESCLSKVNYWNRHVAKLRDKKTIQIVGMSATIPNLKELANDWLESELYISDFRPVPLHEYYVIGTKIYDTQQQVCRDLSQTPEIPRDRDQCVKLCCEVIPEYSCIVFCPTKKNCEQTVRTLFSLLPRSIATSLKEYRSEEKLQLINNLEILWNSQREQNNNRQLLVESIQYGMAFHHSGLISDERSLIEAAFQARVLNVICATSTLAAGVNLPARRVIFRGPRIAQDFLTIGRYKQMAGRAGRAGIDEYGESFLIISGKSEEREKVIELMTRPLDNCVSQLYVNEKTESANEDENQENIATASRLVLEAISSNLCSGREDVKDLARSTMFWNVNVRTNDGLKDKFLSIFEMSCQFLVDNKLISDKKDSSQPQTDNPSTSTAIETEERQEFSITPFGTATYKSTFSLHEASLVSQQLIRARDEGIILSDELQMCFLLTPVDNGVLITPNWTTYLNLYNRLPPIRQKISKMINLEDSILFEKAFSRGAKKASTIEEQKKELVAKRFYNALILCDIINEEPLPKICSTYGLQNAGDLQALMSQASMFSNMMRTFCSHLSWSSLEVLIRQYPDRLAYGVKHELVELVQIDGVNAPLARTLHNMGIQTQNQVAQYSWSQLLKDVTANIGSKHPEPELKKQLLVHFGTNSEDRAKTIVSDVKRILNKKALQYRRLADECEQADDENIDDYSDAEEGAVVFSDDEQNDNTESKQEEDVEDY